MFLLAIWALLESIWWFVIVDALLLPLCVWRPERARRYAIIAIVFSSMGILIHVIITALWPSLSAAIVSSVPLLSQGEIARAGTLLEQSVFWALYQPFSGIPVKAWTLQASSWLFVPLVLMSRAARMGLVAYLGAQLSRFPWLRNAWAIIAYALLVIFVIALI